MKKILALSLALVMLVGVMSVTVAAESAYVDLSNAVGKNPDFTLNGNNSVTLEGTYTTENKNAEIDEFTLGNLIADMNEVHLSQTIKVDQMTKYTQVAVHGDYYKINGLFNTLVKNMTDVDEDPDKTDYKSDYLMYNILRMDDEGGLYLNVYNPSNTGAVTRTVALGKKLGEEFRLTTIWNDDDSASFYVDGTLLETFENATYKQKHYGATAAYLRVGYFDVYNTAATFEDTAKITISNIRVDDDHILEADDGNCMTAIKCADCGVVVTPAASAHTETTDNKGNTVCYVCGTLIKEADPSSTPTESTPVESTPVESTPTESTPVESTPTESTPTESTPVESTPTESTPAASTPAATTPTNPETSDTSVNAVYAVMLAVSLLAVVALMIPDIRNKLIRK